MTEHSSILTPYKLPFAVLHDPLPIFSNNETVIISLEFSNAPSIEAIKKYSAIVTPFHILANTGAMSGDMIPPWKSTVKDMQGPRVSTNSLEWTLEECCLDERAIVILINLLLVVAEKHPIIKLLIKKAEGSTVSMQLECSPDIDEPYPPRWKTIPFLVDESEEDAVDTRHLEINFKRQLADEEYEQVQDILFSWAGVVMNGAYAITSEPPIVAQIIPEPSMILIENRFEWTIEKWRVHTGALDGLVNICVVINHNVAPITQVRIN